MRRRSQNSGLLIQREAKAAPGYGERGLPWQLPEVEDLPAAVERAASDGYGLVGGIGEYEGAWRMAYVRGPRGSSSRWPSASAEPPRIRSCRWFSRPSRKPPAMPFDTAYKRR